MTDGNVIDSRDLKNLNNLKPFEIFSKENKIIDEGEQSKENVESEITKRYLDLSFEELQKFIDQHSKISSKRKQKETNYYIVKYEDIDYHNDWHGGLRDTDIKGIFTSVKSANRCVQSHFASWDKDFFEERLKYKDPDTNLIHIKALCPEGELMECWAEPIEKSNKRDELFLSNNINKNYGKQDIEEWTVNCDDLDEFDEI